MNGFLGQLMVDFLVAMGMVIGGAILGGIGAVFRHDYPMDAMLLLAERLKIWAMVSTLGGTMDTLRAIETGVLDAKFSVLGKQFTYLTAAFFGCQVGFWIIRAIAGGKATSAL